MRAILLLGFLSIVVAAPASPQESHADHATAQSPVAPVADPHAGHAASPAPSDPHAGHQPATTLESHAEHASSSEENTAGSARDLPVGTGSAPSIIRDNAADAVFGAADMDKARKVLADEHGAVLISKVMANILEYGDGTEGGGYRWDLQAWYGGDLNRFVVKTEGEGQSHSGVSLAEVRALYSRAVARYTDFQVGARYDLEPGGRVYATIGIDSVLPYWFDVETALFLSDQGDLLARLEGTYDIRFTQRIILQPRLELEFSAQKIRDLGIGTGLWGGELGFRLRYDIRREFSPYLGVTFHRAFGTTADVARSAGEDVSSRSVVIGLRAWF